MMRASRVIIAGLVIALAMAAIGFAPVARAAMSLPVWTPGDYWIYSMTGVSGAGIPGLEGPGTLRVDVVGAETIAIGASSIATYHTKLNMTVTVSFDSQAVTMYLPGDQWYRVSDLALAKMSLGATFLGLTFSFTATYNPPPEIRWPLTESTSWSTTSVVTLAINLFGNTTTQSQSVTMQHVVEATQSLTVAAGTFTTVPVKDTTTGASDYSRSYWSETVGNWVSQRSYDSLGTQQGGMDLTSYKYQGPSIFNIQFLGLSFLIWLVLIAVVIVAVAAVVLLRRRRPPVPAPMPPMGPMPPQQPPMGQGPPGMPPSPPQGP